MTSTTAEGLLPAGRSLENIWRGDSAAVRHLVEYVKWWVYTWTVPLQPQYDPDEVAAYFWRRPHLLLLRFVQVATAGLLLRANFCLSHHMKTLWF